jgi:hypothetical protein
MNRTLPVALTAWASLVAALPCRGEPVGCEYGVEAYDLQYAIDTARRVFRSTQDIVVTNASGQATHRVCFSLHPELVLDNVELRGPSGEEEQVEGWKTVGTEEVMVGELQAMEVRVRRAIRPGRQVALHIECHLRPGAVRDTPEAGSHPLELTVHTGATHAIGPQTGHLAVFRGRQAAPFRLRIEHPEGELCFAPGRRRVPETRAGLLIETFESDLPGLPTFSCAAYEKSVRTLKGITLEYYLYPGQTFAEEMAGVAADILDLYTRTFGHPGDEVYRLGVVGARDAQDLWWESKGTAIYFTTPTIRHYAEDPFARQMYAGLLAHELFHNWNLFRVHWSGKLSEWFEEGGANFVAAWAGEQLFGLQFAVAGRAFYAGAYDVAHGQRGYDSEQTLESVRKTGGAGQALIYYYGALVWEQLRQKMGDEALIAGLADLFRRYRLKPVGYRELLECLQSRSDVPVGDYLSPWVGHSAVIDLKIGGVTFTGEEGSYRTQVEVVVDADRDYELFTSVGFRTSPEGPLETVDVHIDRRGPFRVTLTSAARPVFIQVDPAYRVPQVHLDNNTWSRSAGANQSEGSS